MRKKSGFTIVEQAIVLVPEFEKVVRKLEQQVTLRGQSNSTLNNYIQRIALFVVNFGKLPEQIDPDEINEYLAALARDPKSPSRSSFKHMVYGLRYYYRLLGMNKSAIALPSLKGNTKLPVILNQLELKELFSAPTLLKQRIVLTLIYSAGLRGQEVINLKISDVDFERKTIHIRQSKYKKDRIVPLAESMAVGLKKYLKAENPHIWLFNGKEPDGRYSVRGLSWVMRENLKKTSITKEVNLHSLRHSYATHLLEQGVNIVTLKELLSHAEITTTMIYLHVAQCPLIKPHSPLDTLYNYPKMRTKFELADVVNRFYSGLANKTKLTPLQTKVLGKIADCRTAALGGHEEACENCGTVRYSYNSCGDRHCPKCQASKQAFWIDDLVQNTLPIKHYHIVFTVPHQLNAVCLHNQRMYYDLLFASVWHALRSFGYSHYGVESGAVAVLHSWGQNLSLHPHIHCIVPAAGYTLDGRWKNIGHSGKYLYPVHQLSSAFKGKFLDSLKRALRKQNELSLFYDKVQQTYKTNWVVHCEPSLAGAEHVIKYLGQYTHRVAITNQRILNIAEGKVTFIAKDYRDRAIKKPVTLDGAEFLRRFVQHILPRRFVKIRRFGIYNHTTKRNLALQFAEEKKPDMDEIIKKKQLPETNVERFERLTGINPCLCPVCKTGRMVAIRELPRIRSPAGFLLK